MSLAVISILFGCGGGGGQSESEIVYPPSSTGVPNIRNYRPMPYGNPPGASEKAFAAQRGIGRGVNFGNMLEAPWEGYWGVSVTDEFIDKAKEAGFTSIRLPVKFSNYAATTPPYEIDPVFMQRVEEVVDKLLAKGFYVVLDMHHYMDIYGQPEHEGAKSLNNPEAVDVRLIMMWEHISQRFKSKSDRLLYELLNEPSSRLNGPDENPGEMWNILAARTLGAIRKIEPDRVVVIGPVFYNTAEMLDYLKLPNDPHIVVTVHHYGPPDFYLQGATFVSPVPPIGVSCCDEERKKVLVESFSIAKRWSDKYKYPIFLGEFGSSIYADADSRSAYNRVMRDGAERNGLTWTYWEFASAFGLYDQEAHAFRPKVMEGLLGD